MWLAHNFLGCAQRVAECAELLWEGSKDDWLTPGALEFQDVELRYQPHLPLVLKGLTLSVAPGTRLGVCGRTTLFLASFRMIDTSRGVILVDGVDIQTVPMLTIRTRL